MTKSSRDNKARKGSAMLETALVFLMLLSMILFVVEMGRILLMQQFITERARVTVRNAVVNNWDSTATANFLCYNSTTAPSQGATGFLGLMPSNVTYTALGSSTNPDYRLQVTVSGVQVFTWIPTIARTYTLPQIVATMPAQSLGSTN